LRTLWFRSFRVKLSLAGNVEPITQQSQLMDARIFQ
jgi:hypothetical protein